jgi:hypothetical protein
LHYQDRTRYKQTNKQNTRCQFVAKKVVDEEHILLKTYVFHSSLLPHALDQLRWPSLDLEQESGKTIISFVSKG